jgi:xanthine dehydrogenase accessory factor
VAVRAREIIRTGEPALMSFDTRLRFGCNGAIDVFIERARDEFLTELGEYLRARRPCTVITTFENAAEATGSRLFGPSETAGGDFIQEIHPPIRLLIVGDGPDSISLHGFAALLGWEVEKFSHASELPDKIDEWTVAIVKTHNYGRDFAALQALLPLQMRYIGLLGPRRRRDQLIDALFDAGITATDQLFAPAGLDLGAESPEQIALAVVSEIQAVFSGGSGELLRDRKMPIHDEQVRHRLEITPRALSSRTNVRDLATDDRLRSSRTTDSACEVPRSRSG